MIGKRFALIALVAGATAATSAINAQESSIVLRKGSTQFYLGVHSATKKPIRILTSKVSSSPRSKLT